MELPGSIDTVVVGAGQAGLIMSRLLSAAGRDHVVLDAPRDAGWRLAGPLGRVPAGVTELDEPGCPASRTTAPIRTGS